ncbi:MAG TPA: PIG-L deacetylase family protein [Acidimicrobiales bacterium]|nr:PIG-L deacetylase family protein [Acidimicrobiales bacterium]
MNTINLTPVPVRAMAVGAHPDDVEFGCGGTLAKWAAQGCEITHVVCTDGSKGSWDPTADVAKLIDTRQAEQRAASRALGGAGDVVFLGGEDGRLDPGLAMQDQLALWIRRIRPEVILGHDPWKRYRLHPDHRAAGFLLTDALVAARDPHFFPEHFVADPHLEPHRPSTLLLWEADEPDHAEDISSSFDAKFAALLCHQSQLLSTMDIGDAANREQIEAFAARTRERAAEHGAAAALPLAESFKRMDRL